MSGAVSPVKGMKDITPEESLRWQYIERVLQSVAAQYGYQEIRFPLLEQTHLFKRTIGDVTDIVEKEMYTFADRNGDSLSLRPEGTAGCVRAGITNNLFYNQVQRLWYMGPMFRYERPQKGRLRQFHHFGVETYGMPSVDIEAEIIAVSHRMFIRLGLQDKVTLLINSLGDATERATYQQALVAYYEQHYDALDADSQRRLNKNPLRILDSKNPETIRINQNAPKLIDALGGASAARFQALCKLLDGFGIAYTVDSSLVRGLDYYNGLVFEWVTDSLGAQGTVCAGGRYDSLVERLGGGSVPALGFACGLERIALMEGTAIDMSVDVFVAPCLEAAAGTALLLAERIRDNNALLSVTVNLTFTSLKSQLKRANKMNARYALLLGEEELAEGLVTIKNLMTGEQSRVSQDSVVDVIN